jgi:alpha-glucuronidase
MSAGFQGGSAGVSRLWRAVVFSVAMMGVAARDGSAAVYGAVARPVDPEAAWLTYAPVDGTKVFGAGAMPDTIFRLGDAEVERTAEEELARGFRGMLGRVVREARGADGLKGSKVFVVVGTQSEVETWRPLLKGTKTIGVDGFRLRHDGDAIVVEGGDARGALYGAFALLRLIAQERTLAAVDVTEAPSAPVRWTNEWDNPDGSIERGYGGRSIFFDEHAVRADISRVKGYARLLASIGINGVTINNVNADPKLLNEANLRGVARVAEEFRAYGVRVSISVDMSSPQLIGGLKTFDPLDAEVAAWWKAKVEEIYRLIPDLGGVVIKADSEGKPGPSQYGRSPADAANVVARALKPHGGLVLYRGFVYNNHLDWNDLKADRARAGFDNFHTLDGKFEDNVVVQIKHGPIDFQIREPVSPLFAGLRKTNEAIELQITQEYTGQQRHLVYLVPMWKEALDTDMHASATEPSRVRDIVTGKTFGHAGGGFVGVANVGLDDYWLGNPLSMANLYGFGRLAWNPTLSAEEIVDEWTRQTFGNNEKVRNAVNDLELRSYHVYESYTGPLGVGTLTDIIGVHFGPGPESAERNGWGQWIRADREGVGMDRTVATGTGYIGQYPPELAAKYESLKTCPDELLLFMHHVPYTYRLHSGKTVIQHIYDSHYKGEAEAAGFAPEWETIAGLVPDRTYFEVRRRLEFQAGHAEVWRDSITQWFWKISGITDAKGRMGNYPGRFEAEGMRLDGYSPVDVTPWESAGGGKAVVCGAEKCSAEMTWDGADGWYDVAVRCFDEMHGESKYSVEVAGRVVEEWKADLNLPNDRLNGHTSTRQVVRAVALHKGDVLMLTAWPDGMEKAPLDYFEIVPVSVTHAATSKTASATTH